MTSSNENKTTIKIQTSQANAKRWKTSAARLGLSRNDYLLALLGNPTQPLPLGRRSERA
jgi:hypothetical protein